MILKLNSGLKDIDRKKLQKKLSKEWDTTVQILPNNLDMIMKDSQDVNIKNCYLVWGKGEFTKDWISKGFKLNGLEESWNKLSKGYDFVIAIYQEDIKGYMLYSVPYFMENIICNG